VITLKNMGKNLGKKFIIFLLMCNMLFLTVSLLSTFAGRYIDYYYNPVMIPGEYISGKMDDKTGFSVISFNATKIRDCQWIETKWYNGSPMGEHNQITMFHGEKPETRPTGLQTWDNTFIYLPLEEIQNESYAIATHSCNPFWKTYSLMFIGKNVETFYDHI
jgi:hypothetical protein